MKDSTTDPRFSELQAELETLRAKVRDLELRPARRRWSFGQRAALTLGLILLSTVLCLGGLTAAGIDPFYIDDNGVHIRPHLKVAGTADVSGEATVGRLRATGEAAVGSLKATGEATVGSLKANGDMTIEGKMDVHGDMNVHGEVRGFPMHDWEKKYWQTTTDKEETFDHNLEALPSLVQVWVRSDGEGDMRRWKPAGILSQNSRNHYWGTVVEGITETSITVSTGDKGLWHGSGNGNHFASGEVWIRLWK